MNIHSMIDDRFSGAVSITQADKTIFQEAFGYADLSNRLSNRVDTRFPTASAGKGFVAVGILQLIEHGGLFLDSRIGDILRFDLKEIDPHITIRQLLTHMSGIPDYFDESTMTDYGELWNEFPNYRVRTSMDLLPLFIDKPMAYPAGARFRYNNAGFVVLGLVIESITGQKFDAYLHDHVFAPTGMNDTGYFELDRVPERCANAYVYDESRKEYYTNIYSVDAKGTGAGGAFTTILDMEHFWRSLLGGGLLSEAMTLEMTSPQIPEDCFEEGSYGYGIWIDREDGRSSVLYLEGCDPGVSFRSSFDKERDLLITLVSNFGSDVWKLHEKIKAAFK
ncbi:MAG TPA: serine hydrolase domain-containing protein [Clostridia bacterium]|nr:serine hydrolase domain-containing protein [Clostridia bacterium]